LQLEIKIEHMHKVGMSAMEITETDIFYEDESFVFLSIIFYSQSKHMVIEKRDVTMGKENLTQRLTLGKCGLPKSPYFTM
jgi:NO-binding membrane sensor protein with MHYT domain